MNVRIERALAKGTTIGFLTWYDCREVHVTPTRLISLFDQHGLDKKHLPDRIKPKNAFQKACRQAMVDTSKSSDNRRSITKLISDGVNKLIYGVVDLNVHEANESIDPDFSDKVWFNKTNLTVDSEKNHPLSRRVVDIYNSLLGEYTTRDISRMIVKTLDALASISLRDAGVIYFVPAAFEEQLVALKNVVNDLGDSNMRVFTLGAGDGNEASVQTEAKSQINDKIEKMRSDIFELRQSIVDGTIKGKTIENSIEVRRRRFAELRTKCHVLADALKIKADSLEGELNEVEKLMEKELTEFLTGAA